MLHHPTLDQLRHLKLHGMARAFAELGDNAQAGELDHAQWLALLLDREEAERNDRRLTYRLRNARLRHPDACIEDVDYRAPRCLDKALFQQLTRGQWITRKQNLIITGPCGVGKSWLACALGQKACRDDFSVLYKRIPRMFAELEMGRADGRYPRLFRALTRANLLILDDWGPDRLNPDQRRDLMEIVEDRYNNAAILVTSQLPLAKWHDVIGEPCAPFPCQLQLSGRLVEPEAPGGRQVEWHPGELVPRVGFIVTNLTRPAERVVAFYNQRGTAEQHIKEGKNAIRWTRLSCQKFRNNEVRLQLHALAYTSRH